MKNLAKKELITKAALLLSLFLIPLESFSQWQMPVILDERERARVQDQWLEERMKTILPELMRREGFDMWVMITREYNEDPVVATLLPATWLSARRRTMLVIYDPGQGKALETLAVARYDVGKSFKRAWDPEKQEDQFQRLSEIIASRDPKKIGINRSDHFGHADGLSLTDYELLKKYLPKKYEGRLQSAERLAVGWLETRTPAEMAVYRQICRIAHQIIAEGFSEQAIQPGITTSEDLVWWYRNRIRQLGLDTWFHPTVTIQRPDPDSQGESRSFAEKPMEQIIQPGDLLWVDFGIQYLGLATDTQNMAYVLKPGEKQAPDYLVKAFEEAKAVTDKLMESFKTGRTGNEMLKATIEQSKAKGYQPQIYSHPIGYHGHGAGPSIGMWDNQVKVPGSGEYPLFPNTAFSIELNARVYVEEWGKELRMSVEEEAFFDGEKIEFIDGRQDQLMIIPRPVEHLQFKDPR